MQKQTSYCSRGLVTTMLILFGITAHGDDEYFKDGTKLVDSEFAHSWAANEEAEERILNGLSQRVDVDIRLSLEKFEKWLQDEHSLPVELDRDTLAEEGITLDLEVHVKGKNLRLEAVLDRALRSLKTKSLSWRIEDESLRITSTAYDCDRREARIFSVKKLLDGGFDLPQIKQLLQVHTNGPWNEHDGEGGEITTLPHGRILVTQTQRVQFQVARLIRRLQELD